MKLKHVIPFIYLLALAAMFLPYVSWHTAGSKMFSMTGIELAFTFYAVIYLRLIIITAIIATILSQVEHKSARYISFAGGAFSIVVLSIYLVELFISGRNDFLGVTQLPDYGFFITASFLGIAVLLSAIIMKTALKPLGNPILIGISGQFAGSKSEFRNGRIIIGRDAYAADLIYPLTNNIVSRRHCTISYNSKSGRFIIEDSSTNGTFLSTGERITHGQAYIDSGDRFYLGSPEELFELRMNPENRVLPQATGSMVKPASDPSVTGQIANQRTTGRPTLIGISGEFAGQRIDMKNEIITIGRDSSYASLVYPPAAKEISGHHCSLYYDFKAACFVLEDYSTNGTYPSKASRLAPAQTNILKSGEQFYLSSRAETFEVRLE